MPRLAGATVPKGSPSPSLGLRGKQDCSSSTEKGPSLAHSPVHGCECMRGMCSGGAGSTCAHGQGTTASLPPISWHRRTKRRLQKTTKPLGKEGRQDPMAWLKVAAL